MKRNKKYNFSTYISGILLLAVGITSCQKSFDPASYAPAQTFGGYTTSREIAASNLVGYWGFENSLIDSVSNKNGNGVGTSFTTGIKGNALQGANNGYFITTPSSAVVGLKSFTISFCVNQFHSTPFHNLLMLLRKVVSVVPAPLKYCRAHNKPCIK